MSGVGRNDPCPCGSGKKFKKCCLSAAGAPTGAYTQAERQSALVALGRFGWRHEFDGDRAAASARFWIPADLLAGGERLQVEEQGQAFFQDWFTTDVRLESAHTLVELFLEREGRRLRSGQLRYLERLRLTHLRPHEVVGVKPDEGLTLLDLWTGKRVEVQERLATRQVVQWDVLAARVMLGPAGVPVLDGLPYLYPARAKDAIVKDLRSLRRRFRRRVPGDDVDFFKRFGSVFFAWWIEHVILAARLAFRTAEGDEMVLASAVFDVRDRQALDRALAGHPDLDRQDDGSYAWHEPGGDDEFRGPRVLESLAGDAVRHRATSFESVEQAVERGPVQPAREGDQIPPEVQAKVAGAYYDKHYRGWVDTPLPALGGQTPRDAARTKTGRPRVVALLKDMESLSARQRLEGELAYDFGWMWGDLGLDRPG